MQSLERNGYTDDAVKKSLHAPNRTIAFRYDLLDSNNTLKKQLDNVLAASVSYNSLAEIKRTARFSLLDDGTINFLSDRIKPWARLKMPDGGWAEFPLGVFVLSTPPRSTNAAGSIIREVEAYDLLQVLTDDKVADRYTVTAGTNYISAVKSILDSAGITQQNLTATDKTLPTDRDWAPGTKKLSISNDMLGAINDRSLSIDENGYAVAQPYVTPTVRASEYTYRDDQDSVIFPEVEHQLDLFNIPNKWVLYVSEADRPALRSVYTNTDQNSQTSTVSRGRTVMADPIQVDAADQSTLDAKAQRKAFEASQVYESLEFESGVMPMHSDSDVLTLEYSKLGLSAKYSETSWELDLKAGAKMKHRIRRVVSI